MENQDIVEELRLAIKDRNYDKCDGLIQSNLFLTTPLTDWRKLYDFMITMLGYCESGDSIEKFNLYVQRLIISDSRVVFLLLIREINHEFLDAESNRTVKKYYIALIRSLLTTDLIDIDENATFGDFIQNYRLLTKETHNINNFDLILIFQDLDYSKVTKIPTLLVYECNMSFGKGEIHMILETTYKKMHIYKFINMCNYFYKIPSPDVIKRISIETLLMINPKILIINDLSARKSECPYDLSNTSTSQQLIVSANQIEKYLNMDNALALLCYKTYDEQYQAFLRLLSRSHICCNINASCELIQIFNILYKQNITGIQEAITHDDGTTPRYIDMGIFKFFKLEDPNRIKLLDSCMEYAIEKGYILENYEFLFAEDEFNTFNISNFIQLVANNHIGYVNNIIDDFYYSDQMSMIKASCYKSIVKIPEIKAKLDSFMKKTIQISKQCEKCLNATAIFILQEQCLCKTCCRDIDNAISIHWNE